MKTFDEYKEEIQPKFNKILAFSQNMNIDDINTDKLFAEWFEAKKNFASFIGDLIYESDEPITLELTEEEKKDRAYAFCSEVDVYSPTLSEFLLENIDGFYVNKTVVDYYTPNGELIPAGMRIGKCIRKYFSAEMLENDIEYVRNEMSMIIQECKVTGKLCLSVHPIDFLSSSENACNWHSCHSLNGEFRSGNLSYMLDKVTVMAYIKSERDCNISNFPEDIKWNNKKWRCLFFFDSNNRTVWAGRQYPFFSASALDFIKQIFINVRYFTDNITNATVYKIPKWVKNVSSGAGVNGVIFGNKRMAYFHDMMLPIKYFVKDAPNSLHYNDLTSSHCYLPYTLGYPPMAFGKKEKISTPNDLKPPMEVGSAAPCIKCAKKYIYDSDCMLCFDCTFESNIENDSFGYCDNCDTRIQKLEEYNYHNWYYCEECYKKLYCECPSCTFVFPRATIKPDNKKGLCKYCLESAD